MTNLIVCYSKVGAYIQDNARGTSVLRPVEPLVPLVWRCRPNPPFLLLVVNKVQNLANALDFILNIDFLIQFKK